MEKLLDKDIREPLFLFLEQHYEKTRFFEERNIWSARADIVMITDGSITGIEIKSDADSYARLPNQVKTYDKFFDKNIIVVGSTHAAHAAEHVPSYWGIISVENIAGALDFLVIREPGANPKLDWKKKLWIMWRPELAALQEQFDIPKYKQKSKEFVIGKIAERAGTKIEIDALNRAITDILFERDYNTIASDLKEYRRKNKKR